MSRANMRNVMQLEHTYAARTYVSPTREDANCINAPVRERMFTQHNDAIRAQTETIISPIVRQWHAKFTKTDVARVQNFNFIRGNRVNYYRRRGQFMLNCAQR